MTINSKKIFVTAEIGSSWQGDFSILQRMIERLKVADVDAVKFQSLSKEILQKHKELKYYHFSSVSKDNINQIVEICDFLEMEFYSTVTYSDAIDFLNPHVKRFKIRSADNNKPTLVSDCLGTGKEVIISSLKPIKQITSQIKNLYCIPRYPVEFGEYNFACLKSFQGFSNHCKNPLAILCAVLTGEKHIEFHVTPSLSFFNLDNSVSFDIDQTLQLMKWIRLYENWNNNSG